MELSVDGFIADLEDEEFDDDALVLFHCQDPMSLNVLSSIKDIVESRQFPVKTVDFIAVDLDSASESDLQTIEIIKVPQLRLYQKDKTVRKFQPAADKDKLYTQLENINRLIEKDLLKD